MYVDDLLGSSRVTEIPYGGTKQLRCEPGACDTDALADRPLAFALPQAPWPLLVELW